VDVSPDGRTIAFDLLGDIYTMPISGGTATRLIGGNPIDVQPRFSPDGKSLVFISDRGGSDAVWIADADGKHARQVAQIPGNFISEFFATGIGQPIWTPDGKFILAGGKLFDSRGGVG